MEFQLRAGHPDTEGLCLALLDWSAELRLLRESRSLATIAPRLAHVGSSRAQSAYRPSLPGRAPGGWYCDQKQKSPPRPKPGGQEEGGRR